VDSNKNIQRCWNSKFLDLSIFSFYPVKYIAIGEGGMVSTNDLALYKKLLMLRRHCITKTSSKFTNTTLFANSELPLLEKDQNKYPGWYMKMQELDSYYRLTAFQAVLGFSQMNKADNGLKRRREIASKYAKAFEGKSWIRTQSGSFEVIHIICILFIR
jgi:dTDP-4-amino-4,6-dideoxygalactose transaminase